MFKKSFKQIIGLFLLIVLITGCAAQATPAPTEIPPTEMPATATLEPATATPEPSPAPTAESWPTVDGGKMEFNAGTTGMHFPGDLEPHSAIRFHLTASQGQQMNIWLTPEPADAATLYISDSTGKALTEGNTTFFSKVLDSTQEYYIEIRSLVQDTVYYSFSIDIPAGQIDPANASKYEPIDAGLCQSLGEVATQALGVEFYLSPVAPFFDVLGGDAGLGCNLSTQGTGAQFTNPQGVVDALRDSVALGWTEQPSYAAGGPTGSSTAYSRDMALMVVSSSWTPAMGSVCPSDQPISSCNLKPEEKAYSITIDVAQYKADFSLDGHWEDASNGFTLNLTQEWKTIGGMHVFVADGGNKIDTLDVSITGMIKGQGADIQFQSSFTTEPGLARIDVIDPNTISWKIIQAPAGEFYLPAEATLTR